jgi:alpha-ketoglutarate-dependent taurine dioxygenase
MSITDDSTISQIAADAERSGPLLVLHRSSDGLASELSLETFQKLYREHGAILLRGSITSTEDFIEISERFGGEWIPYQLGGRDTVSDSHNIQTVNTGSDAIAPHGELCHMPLQPGMAWFYCEEPPLEGGQTTLYDGVDLAANMPAELKQAFSGRKLRYHFRADIDEALELYQVSNVDELRSLIEKRGWGEFLKIDGSEFTQDYRVSVFGIHSASGKPVFLNQLIHNARFTNFYAQIVRRFRNIALLRPWLPRIIQLLDVLPWRMCNTPRGHGVCYYPSLDDGKLVARSTIQALARFVWSKEIAIEWQKGDVLVFDNTRFMHGRRSVNDDQRRILTRFGFPR